MFIKYSRFIFLLCTDMAMNVFFFSDDTMHKMFLDYGKYNFIQQIPQIIYSTIISQLIEIFLCYLSLTDKHFYQVKECKKVSKKSMLGIMKCIQIKICFFFVFTSVIFIFYWYLVTCFCAVYQNTQIAFIKDSLLSFVLSISIPFGLYLIPSFLRIISLKVKKFKLEFVYKASGVIPFFWLLNAQIEKKKFDYVYNLNLLLYGAMVLIIYLNFIKNNNYYYFYKINLW